jgi:hypothetical protein
MEAKCLPYQSTLNGWWFVHVPGGKKPSGFAASSFTHAGVDTGAGCSLHPGNISKTAGHSIPQVRITTTAQA